MATVKDDILEGTRGIKDYYGWLEVDRIIIISEINLATIGWTAKVNEAITAAGITIGSAHPDVSYIYLRRIQPEGLSNDTVRLICYYTRYAYQRTHFEQNAIEVGASVVSVETNKDKDENEMFLSYTYPVGYQRSPHDDPLTAEKNIEVGHLTNKFVPDLAWSKNKIETSSPESTAKNYVGKVNSSSWRGYSERTWLCTRIYGRSSDGGETYNVIYEFQYRPDTWNHIAVFIKDDGKPPKATDANSKKTYQLYDEINFGNLSL